MKAVRYRQLGGWNARNTVGNLRHLFRVTIHTPIDSWDDYILAKDRQELDSLLKTMYPDGWIEGFEPTVTQLTESFSLNSVFTTL